MTLNWKNVRTVVLLATVILGMSSVFIYLSVSRPISRKSFLEPEWPIEGQEVSFTQAQASVTFKIGLPTNMGTPAEIKLELPPHSIPERVYIIYAANKPSKDATTNDVLDQDGIILFEAPHLTTLNDATLNILAAINSTKFQGADGLKEVNINGYVGCTGGTFSNCVTWCTETTFYELTANFNHPMQQLIEIAQSIPVK
jgi:hypothetical protein